MWQWSDLYTAKYILHVFAVVYMKEEIKLTKSNILTGNFLSTRTAAVHFNRGASCESNLGAMWIQPRSLLWIQPRSLLWIQPRCLMWIQPRSLLWIQPIRGGSSFLKRGGQSLNKIGYSNEQNVVSKFYKEISIKSEYFRCSKQKITLIVCKNIATLVLHLLFFHSDILLYKKYISISIGIT